ncbi:MAG: hypothetical protein K8R92_00720 [Planctomycetes bacterium]|nr:hypothetical protein [Planctomycetota bacterium]
MSGSTDNPAPAERTKTCYVGAPSIFALEQACQMLGDAFGRFNCYLVGSAMVRKDWRDVDVRMILPDDEFAKLFPAALADANQFQFDPRWLLLTVAISERLSKLTGLPIDFQFQPMTIANKRHTGPRHALGLRVA